MTTETATHILNRHLKKYQKPRLSATGDNLNEFDVQALQMAIKALEETDKCCKNCIRFTKDSYIFNIYPCSECKHRARDSFERG